MTSISDLLAQRNTRLDDAKVSLSEARGRAPVTRLLAHSFLAYAGVRAHLANPNQHPMPRPLSANQHQIVDRLVKERLVEGDASRLKARPGRLEYLRGQWLEEWALLAVLEAGCDEAVAGQNLTWWSDDPRGGGRLEGKNEVDVIARRGDRMLFISCKCLSVMLDKGERIKVRGYIHETDDLADHFGGPDDIVALLLTADMIDEAVNRPRGRARHPELSGKAAAIDVHLLSFEDLNWDTLVGRIKALWDLPGNDAQQPQITAPAFDGV